MVMTHSATSRKLGQSTLAISTTTAAKMTAVITEALAKLLRCFSRTSDVSSSSVCRPTDRKSTRLNSSHVSISYAVFCLKKKNQVEKRLYTTHKDVQDNS